MPQRLTLLLNSETEKGAESPGVTKVPLIQAQLSFTFNIHYRMLIWCFLLYSDTDFKLKNPVNKIELLTQMH